MLLYSSSWPSILELPELLKGYLYCSRNGLAILYPVLEGRLLLVKYMVYAVQDVRHH